MTQLWPPCHGKFRYISAPPSPDWAARRPRTLTLLGSTGSIGVNALRVAESLPELFRVTALAGARNTALLARQAARWRPAWLGVLNDRAAGELRALLPAHYHPQIVVGPEGYAHLASLPEVTTVLSAQVGAAGLRGTLSAALAGKVVCLANKESLVLAGDLIRAVCGRTGAVILPVDSEHNAIFQCLAGRPARNVRRIVLTASGGPFRGRGREALAAVTREDALKHPNWSMGAKITIDSATLMNKGLEIMEACHLYGAALEDIEVVVHPQSVIHSLVEFADGSQMAQLGAPDMRLAIAHCLAWPHCLPTGVPPLDLTRVGALTFERPDTRAFPCLELARRALRERGGHCVVLNAANEAAVALFLAGRIAFLDIPALLERALDAHAASAPGHDPLLRDDPAAQTAALLEAAARLDAQTRRQVRRWAGIQDTIS